MPRQLFKPGHAKTPGSGRPKGSKDKFSAEELMKSFERAKNNNTVAPPGMSIYDWLAVCAYEDHTLAVALLRKVMPDMRQVEVIKQYEGGYADLSPAEACEQMDQATLGEKPDA